MKSNDGLSSTGKGRGRPPGRKRSTQRNSDACENENSKSLQDLYSSPQSDSARQTEIKHEGSTPRRKKNPLANLQSNLSQKYIGFDNPTSTEKRKTKYRTARLKDPDDSPSYFRSSQSLIGCVRSTTTSDRLRSPFSSPETTRKRYNFVSPIEKLLCKNGAASKSLPNLLIDEIFEDDALTAKERSDDVQTTQRNCIVRIEQINHDEFMPNSGNASNETVTPDEDANLHSFLEEQCKIANLINNQAAQHLSSEGTVNVSDCHKHVDQVYTNSDSVSVKIPSDKENPTNSGENEYHPTTSQRFNPTESFYTEDLPSIQSPSTMSVDSAKGSSLDNDLNWVSIGVGDLFWGQIYQFSYWPCMVCPDLEGKTLKNGRFPSKDVVLHVRFFADNGRRGWVRRDNMLPFTGIEDYRTRMKEAEKKYGKNSQKFKVYLVSKAKRQLWNQAVKEANYIDQIPINYRLDKFFEILDNIKYRKIMERKRRKSMYFISPTSDVNSIFGSNHNLLQDQPEGIKRDRSTSPISLDYSPLHSKNDKKRIKLDPNTSSSVSEDPANNESETKSETPENQVAVCTDMESIPTEDIYSDSDFSKFVSTMRAFVFNNVNDGHLELQFMSYVRSIWALRHIVQQNQQEIEPKEKEDKSPASMKRLSQRIRNISMRKSQPVTPVQVQQPVEKRPAVPKPKKTMVRSIEEVIDDIFQLDSKYLFRGVSKDPVCKECLQVGPDVIKCSKNCQGWLHPACAATYINENTLTSKAETPPFIHITGDSNEESITKPMPQIVCKNCDSGAPNTCFVCKKNDRELGELARCSSQHCSKSYHPHCLRYWPQAKLTKSTGKLESLRCPAHVCHTCISDDPKGKFLQIEKSKLTKCIHCPATYHMDSTCIPAGSQFLSMAYIICPRHSKHQEPFINVNWCFICVAGGNLVCCETCPTAVHAECLKIPIADEGYICEECETGRMPLYGEMVWAKFNNFRWWPSLILPPPEVPKNLERKAHNPTEFVIRFFGTNDHAWISRRRVYLYQEGDCSEPPRNYKKGLDNNYLKGVEEAKRIAEIMKVKKNALRANDKKQRISPLPYVKIKSNRAVPPIKLQVNLEKISKCDCTKDSPNPCGQDSGCLNRMLFTECNPKICPAGERCQNQMFEKKVYPKLDVRYMNEKGFGLICLEDICAGTFVIEYVGEVIDDAEFRRRIAQKEQERDENFYFLTLEKDYIIDAGPKGNMARFMNHSCDPNCETQKWSVNGLNRIGLFAIKDIPKDTELTFNYFWDELLGNEKKSCYCGTAKCVGLIGGKYKSTKQEPQTQKLRKRHMTKSKHKSSKADIKKVRKSVVKKGRPRKSSANDSKNNSTASISISTDDNLGTTGVENDQATSEVKEKQTNHLGS